jgi:membrane peptidoglycan carboxypeptidase
MITDPKTGEILTMIGSKDYNDSRSGKFNVTTALRQPGSSIKPVTYAEAFKTGFSPGNTILDIATTFKDPWGSKYSPINYDGRFHGAVSIRSALGSSFNIPAVKTLASVGTANMIKTASDLGITTFTEPQRYGLSLTLGGAEVRMIDMMAVYGTFANSGLRVNLNPILKIVDSEGNILEESKPRAKNVLKPEVAYMINNILSDNNARSQAFGTNSLLNIKGFTVGVKTGTTDNKRDNWTFGYTPDTVVGVWVGNNDNSPMHPKLTSGVSGAAPIWNKIMLEVLKNKKNTPFEIPKGIKIGIVDGRKDLVIEGLERKSMIKFAKDEAGKIIISDPYSSYASPSGQAALETKTN